MEIVTGTVAKLAIRRTGQAPQVDKHTTPEHTQGLPRKSASQTNSIHHHHHLYLRRHIPKPIGQMSPKRLDGPGRLDKQDTPLIPLRHAVLCVKHQVMLEFPQHAFADTRGLWHGAERPCRDVEPLLAVFVGDLFGEWGAIVGTCIDEDEVHRFVGLA